MTEDYNEKALYSEYTILIDFNRTFNNAHNVSALVGVSNESYTKQASRIAWEYTDEDLGLPTTDESIQNKDNKTRTMIRTRQALLPYLVVGYNYMDKYYGDVSLSVMTVLQNLPKISAGGSSSVPLPAGRMPKKPYRKAKPGIKTERM